MTTKLCIYKAYEGHYRCTMCGDITENAGLKRVCPMLRDVPVTERKLWTYGVTTVPDRLENGLLFRTLASLASAGFDQPRLFIDGYVKLEEDLGVTFLRFNDKQLQAVTHAPKLRTFGNWVLALWELYVRDPWHDRYAIFQDDCIAVEGLREYLDRCNYPARGYWNLYTFPENRRKHKSGWYLSNQRGKGAVGLVFSNEAVRTVLQAPHMVNRPQDARRGHRAIDGGIVTAFKKAGWDEYVHNPSLLQHTGKESSMGNGEHPESNCFPGEDTNILKTMPKPEARPPVKQKRIGLVTDDSRKDYERFHHVVQYCDIHCWMVKHPRKTTDPGSFRGVEVVVCNNGVPRKMEMFLKQIDILVFPGRPPYADLTRLAKNMKKRVVCLADNTTRDYTYIDKVVRSFDWPKREADWAGVRKVFNDVVRSE